MESLVSHLPYHTLCILQSYTIRRLSWVVLVVLRRRQNSRRPPPAAALLHKVEAFPLLLLQHTTMSLRHQLANHFHAPIALVMVASVNQVLGLAASGQLNCLHNLWYEAAWTLCPMLALSYLF